MANETSTHLANSQLTPAQRVALARQAGRPGTPDFVSALFTDFFEQRGDRCCMDDGAIYGGVGFFHGRPVTTDTTGTVSREDSANVEAMASPWPWASASRPG